MTSANWLYGCPVMPGSVAAGRNTLAKTNITATMERNRSLMPARAASCGVSPRSRWDMVASTTMIESSTMSPIASTSAKSDIMFTEKPAMFRKTNAPMRVTGMTTAGPTAARKFWRKTSTTSMTSTMDFTKVRYTCVTAMETKCDVSNGIVQRMSGGKSLDSFSMALRMLAAVSRALASGSW